MKKNISLALAILLSGLGANAQSPQWISGTSVIPFSGSGPGTPATITGAAGYASGSNAAFDQNGNLLFYVRGEKVYNSSSTLVGSLGPVLSPTKEIGIVNVPGTCNQFYVITMSAYPVCISCTNHIQYSLVTVSGSSITVGSPQNLGYGGTGGFAISKLRADKTRFLFYAGSTVERFVIANSGITHAQTVMSSAGNIVSDVELYEDNATGNMRLAWGDNYVGLQIVTLDSSGSYTTNYTPSIIGLNAVNGVEFINYNELLIANDNSTASQKGLAKINISGSLSVSFIPNTSAYYNSYIEKAVDGNFYTTKPYVVSGSTVGYKIATINYSSSTVTEVPGITLSSVDIGGSIRLLPDQVDNENYINANYKTDLMVRDAVTDLGLEPNPSDDVWSSPDLWNRRNNFGSPDNNQEPGYAGGGNLMKVRIKNKGCIASQSSYVKLYWTLGATLERWPASWNGSTLINTKIAGDEIKTAGLGYANYVTVGGVDMGYEIPSILPGHDTVIIAKWYPPDPADYNDSSRVGPNAMICFLARIDDSNQDPIYSELSSSTTSVGHNVKYNNNIATRNTFLTNMSGSYLVVPGGSVLVGNYLEEATVFNVRIRAHGADAVAFGDIGRVTLRMDEVLWNAWINGGAAGEGVEIQNYENREVRVSNLENAVLRNINMQPGELMGIASYFELTTATDIVQTYGFAISQEKMIPEDTDEAYGSECVFMVSVNGQQPSDDGSDGTVPTAPTVPAGPAQPLSKMISLNGNNLVELFPNPNTGISRLKFNMVEAGNVSVRIFDLSGKVVKTIFDVQKMPEGVQEINVSSDGLANGTYMIQLVAPKIHATKKMKVMRP